MRKISGGIYWAYISSKARGVEEWGGWLIVR